MDFHEALQFGNQENIKLNRLNSFY